MSAAASGYVGRFAPSPTGPLHAGSMVAALASWLDARAHRGRWLLRIEDVDLPRCVAGAEATIHAQLAACGLHADAPPWRQSERGPAYRQALERLQGVGRAYPCGCTRSDVLHALRDRGAAVSRHGERVYPGTCRSGLQGKAARAVRVLTVATGHPIEPGRTAAAIVASDNTSAVVDWNDRRLGGQSQRVADAVGDFVLLRADGCWSYQLAVVVDDAAQGVTDVVRGADLADNTPRQIHLQRLLGLPTPRYLHTPLVLGSNGEKLSKQNGAAGVDGHAPLAVLRAAGAMLDLYPAATDVTRWLDEATSAWADRWAGSTKHAAA
jgi:glutamyl-Q tRNA(Asp) synthetase